MRYLGISLLFFIPSVSMAYVPIVNDVPTQTDIVRIVDPESSQGFYGTLNDMPHTYEIQVDEPVLLTARILVPDTHAATNNINAIIVRFPDKKGRVEEVGRLDYTTAAWESWFDFFGGDRYRVGASFSQEIGTGRYHIQVYTADNAEQYVLHVGTNEDVHISYFEMLKRIALVKEFLDKPSFLMIQSVYVYGPLVLFLCIGGIFFHLRRKRA